MNDNLITAEQAREILAYDAVTGTFVWKVPLGTAIAGSKAGYLNPRGYVVISIKRRLYRAHRIAFLVMTGKWPKYGVDHINGIKNDNRWINLRDVPDAINIQNKRKSRNGRKNVGLPLGVQRNRCKVSKKPYLAKIQVAGRSIYLGSFSTTSEASTAYIEAKRRLHKGCTL